MTLEWLGHYLFGARKGLNSDGWADGFYDQRAAREQQNTSGKSGGQGSDDGEQLMAVQDIGYNDAHFMKLFSDVQTKNAAEAIKKVKEFLVEQGIAQNIDAIDCPVNLVSKCRKRVGYQDYVICIVDKIHYQFEFDDICDVKLNGNDPVAGRPYSDYGGYIVRPGRM